VDEAADSSVGWGWTTFQLTTEWAEHSFTAEALSDQGKLEFLCAGVEVPFWMDFVSVYEPTIIPAPSAILLGTTGIGFVT
jgi:hypothetical protein